MNISKFGFQFVDSEIALASFRAKKFRRSVFHDFESAGGCCIQVLRLINFTIAWRITKK